MDTKTDWAPSMRADRGEGEIHCKNPPSGADNEMIMLDAAAAPSDQILLHAWVQARDEAAYATLVGRHGDLVVAVARRILGDAHDAEDAAQAVFVVLLRRAPELVDHPNLIGWLHRTATHVALTAREAAAARARREGHELPETAPAPRPETAPEWAPHLDAALSELPDRYRMPMLLVHGEGLTQHQVAARLGVSPGTVASWLSRGRERLRAALARRGVVVGAATLASVTLVPSGGHAATPALLAQLSTLPVGEPLPAVAILAQTSWANTTVAPLALTTFTTGVLSVTIAISSFALVGAAFLWQGITAEAPAAVAANETTPAATIPIADTPAPEALPAGVLAWVAIPDLQALRTGMASYVQAFSKETDLRADKILTQFPKNWQRPVQLVAVQGLPPQAYGFVVGQEMAAPMELPYDERERPPFLAVDGALAFSPNYKPIPEDQRALITSTWNSIRQRTVPKTGLAVFQADGTGFANLLRMASMAFKSSGEPIPIEMNGVLKPEYVWNLASLLDQIQTLQLSLDLKQGDRAVADLVLGTKANTDLSKLFQTSTTPEILDWVETLPSQPTTMIRLGGKLPITFLLHLLANAYAANSGGKPAQPERAAFLRRLADLPFDGRFGHSLGLAPKDSTIMSEITVLGMTQADTALTAFHGLLAPIAGTDKADWLPTIPGNRLIKLNPPEPRGDLTTLRLRMANPLNASTAWTAEAMLIGSNNQVAAFSPEQAETGRLIVTGKAKRIPLVASAWYGPGWDGYGDASVPLLVGHVIRNKTPATPYIAKFLSAYDQQIAKSAILPKDITHAFFTWRANDRVLRFVTSVPAMAILVPITASKAASTTAEQSVAKPQMSAVSEPQAEPPSKPNF